MLVYLQLVCVNTIVTHHSRQQQIQRSSTEKLTSLAYKIQRNKTAFYTIINIMKPCTMNLPHKRMLSRLTEQRRLLF